MSSGPLRLEPWPPQRCCGHMAELGVPNPPDVAQILTACVRHGVSRRHTSGHPRAGAELESGPPDVLTPSRASLQLSCLKRCPFRSTGATVFAFLCFFSMVLLFKMNPRHWYS